MVARQERSRNVLIGYEPADQAEAFVERTGETLPHRFQGGEMAEP
jgi:hypothetical protein